MSILQVHITHKSQLKSRYVGEAIPSFGKVNIQMKKALWKPPLGYILVSTEYLANNVIRSQFACYDLLLKLESDELVIALCVWDFEHGM